VGLWPPESVEEVLEALSVEPTAQLRSNLYGLNGLNPWPEGIARDRVIQLYVRSGR